MSAVPQVPSVSPPGGSLSALDRAILETVTYASLFQYPLTVRELHRGLMGAECSLHVLRAQLCAGALSQHLRLVDGYVVPRDCIGWLALRRQREARSLELVGRHENVLRTIMRFPYVRLVALSGACARGNATDDDVDIFLVTAPGRAWLVAAGLMVLAKARGVRRTLCVNYIVDEDALSLEQTDFFTASEIAGMKPLHGRTVYRRFVEANGWARPLLPNFYASHYADSAAVSEAAPGPWDRLLGRALGAVLERVARLVLGTYLGAKTRNAPGVVLDAHRLKLHTIDHRPFLTQAFERALQEALVEP